jgi:acetylornithine deacetylase/succinyl-diaminopimelate desuccinylase-like protein
LTVEAHETGNGIAAETDGPAYEAARAAMTAAWGSPPAFAASGGSIPLVMALREAVPEAEILLLGTTDGYSNIHAPNERVLVDEFEKATIAEAVFFQELAAGGAT